MPLEVSPVPFPNQQLPGFPKFAPPHIEGLSSEGSSPGSGHGYAHSGPGGLRGPESVAANTLISPVPGGIAGPHRAIPALPEAGYTSPTIAMGGPAASSLGGGGYTRPRTIGIGGFGGAPSAVGMIHETGSVYAGGSLYGGHSGAPSGGLQLHGMDGPVGASGGWAPGSLPAPRHMLHVGSPPRGHTMQFPSTRRGSWDEGHQSSPRDHEHNHHHEHDHNSHHDHTHHHQHSHASPEREHEHHHHHHQRDRRDSLVDDDGMTDVSYYARPRARRRSRSISSASEVSVTPRQASRRRTTSMQPRSPSRLAVPRLRSPSRNPGHHDHFPLSPSPLTRSPRRADSDSERGRGRYEDAEELGDRMENLDIDDRRGTSRHKRKSRLLERERRQSESDSDTEPSRYPSRHADHHHHHGEGESRHRRPSNAEHHHDYRTRMQSRARGDAEQPPRSPPREQEPERRHVRGHSQGENDHDNSRDNHPPRDHSQHRPHMHHRHRSASHLDEPLFRAPASISPSEAISQAHHRHHEGLPRPRAQSSYQLREPPAGLMNPYLGQSEVGIEPGTLYDDGGSVAGTALTFTDGAVGGRVSQYGLPKYPHQPKMDYRRFMVQRGKADVFMD